MPPATSAEDEEMSRHVQKPSCKVAEETLNPICWEISQKQRTDSFRTSPLSAAATVEAFFHSDNEPGKGGRSTATLLKANVIGIYCAPSQPMYDRNLRDDIAIKVIDAFRRQVDPKTTNRRLLRCYFTATLESFREHRNVTLNEERSSRGR